MVVFRAFASFAVLGELCEKEGRGSLRFAEVRSAKFAKDRKARKAEGLLVICTTHRIQTGAILRLRLLVIKLIRSHVGNIEAISYWNSL